MSDQQIFELVRKELFKDGANINQWKFVRLEHEGRIAAFEAMIPNRGNIRIRKPIKKMWINSDNQEIWLYNVLRFTNKRELKDDCFMEDIRLDQQISI